jgi:GH24 family phage-related lysozyme (muramidase)
LAGYSVTFSVIDAATRQIDNITKRIQQMRAPLERQARSVQQFADASGLKKMAEGFGEVGDAGAEAFESVSRLVPALGAITGAASIAGMAEFVKEWADWGVELQRNADRIGTTSQELQTFQAATLEAGGSVEDMTGSLKGLTDLAAGAFTGRNVDAIAWFNRAGISIRDANGHLRTSTQLLPEVLRYLDGIKNPADRATAALHLGGQELYNLDEDFRRSGQSIDQWLGKARQLPTLTNEQIEAEQRWKEANGQLEASFSSLAAQIGATAAEGMTPLLDSFNQFLTTNQPQIIAGLKDLQNEITSMLTQDKALVTSLFSSVKSLVTLTPLKPTASEILAGSPLAAGLSAKEKMDILAADQNAKAPAPIPSFSDLFSGKVGVGEFVRGRMLQPSPASTTLTPPTTPGPPAPANTNVPLSQGAGDFIKRQEGLSLRPYSDVGHQAIGYGHDFTPAELAQGYALGDKGERIPTTGNISRDQANALFRADYQKRTNTVAKQVPGFDKLGGNQQEAIMSYYYNTGRLPAGLAQNVQGGNMAAIAESLRHGIATVHGETFAPLVKRRQEEAQLFSTPGAPATPQVQLASNLNAPAAPAPAPAAGKPAQVTGGPPVSGSVDVTITHKNPPPGAVVTASATGDGLTVAPPRTEQQQLSAA